MSLSNVTPVLVLQRYMLFGIVPAEMKVGVKYLEILQAEFKSACKHSGAQLVGLFSRHAKSFKNNICAIVTFDTVHAACDTSLAFSNSMSLLQCGHTPAYFSTVLLLCYSVMRQCIFMKNQLHLSHTVVECANKFSNTTWQLQTTIRR